MRRTIQNDIQLTCGDEQNPLGLRIGFGTGRAATGGNLHNILREGFGETCQRPGNDPGTGFIPVRQVRRHDIAHHPFWDHHIGRCENRAACHQIGLPWQTSGRDCVIVFGHRATFRNPVSYDTEGAQVKVLFGFHQCNDVLEPTAIVRPSDRRSRDLQPAFGSESLLSTSPRNAC